MASEISRAKRRQCPFPGCLSTSAGVGPDSRSGRIVRKGFYFRASDHKRLPRFQCRSCGRSFSMGTFSPCYRQKKRRLNSRVYLLMCSGVSLRRTAKILQVNRKTVVRKFLFAADQANARHKEFLDGLQASGQRISEIQFDEMESSERSKCLPLSIPLVVEKGTRKVLGWRVCPMPASGQIAAISRKKYGLRRDERKPAAASLFQELTPVIAPDARITTDQNPKYPDWIRAHLPHALHRTFKGRRGAVVGQGELKKVGFDPLFSLNHTCAMLRANINRLFRRTWCTTKRADRLNAHIAIYVDYHNRFLTGG